MTPKCDIYDEAFQDIRRRLSSIESKMDLIIKLQSDFEYLKEDLNEHKNNGIIHIGKIWGVITAIIAVMITLIPH